MSRTLSNNISLGFKAPDFYLPQTNTNNFYSLSDFKSNSATVIMFICNHCPFVKHVINGIVKVTEDYMPKGIKFVAISSNDVENYPDDAPEEMNKFAKNQNFKFPYLYDESQEAAKSYQAACTPDFYIFDKNLTLVYHGQLDDSRPGNNIPVTGLDIRKALDAILADTKINELQKPSLGCNIKWK